MVSTSSAKDYGRYYGNEFYERQSEGSLKSAEVILPIVLEIVPDINSVVDFGCGIGTWLSVLKQMGISDIKGYDGAWGKTDLKIPIECFTAVEFGNEVINTEKKI